MAGPNGRPRRVSMAYILGFSNKPYKDPPAPRPPQPSGLAQLMSSPGGIVEWTASDGRKGKISGAGKQRLTAASLAKVPSEKRSVKDALKESGDGKKDDEDNPHGWTSEDDKKLIDWKAEFSNAAWAECVAVVGKPEHQCKERFKKIKPADWKPLNAKGKGGGGNQKSAKKDKKQKQNADATEGNDATGAADTGGDDNPWGAAGLFENSGEENKNDSGNDKNTTWDNTGGDAGNNTTWDNTAGWPGTGDKNGNNNGNNNATAWGAPAQDSGNNGGGNAGDQWNSSAAAGGAGDAGDATDPWNTGTAAGGGAVPGWDTANNDGGIAGTGDNPDWGADAWGTTNPAPAKSATKANTHHGSKHHESKARSDHHSQHKSHSHHGRSTAAPRSIEVTPDSTFSADDLRIVARILQQDCSMVWNRVSWRFRDKTGRNVHPDVFEKKITGQVEGKESERGGRRAK